MSSSINLIGKAKAVLGGIGSSLIALQAIATSCMGRLILRLRGTEGDNQQIDPSQVKSALVVRADEIGDVVMSSSFLRELRRLLPDAWITLVVNPGVYNLVEFCPYVDEVLTYNQKASLYLRPFKLPWRAFWLAYRYLWARQFDLAILPRWDTDNCYASFVAYFSGARWRVGYSEHVLDRKQQLNAGFDRLLTDVIDHRGSKHEVERNLGVLRYLAADVLHDRLEVWLDKEDRSFAQRVFEDQGIGPNDRVFAFVPGARDPKRRWPIERFARLGQLILQEYETSLVVIGGTEDRQLGARLETELGPKVINLTGRTALRQTAAVLERCQLAIANDCGPMHLAAAAGSAVVEVSCHPQNGASNHYNSPVRFRPWGSSHVVLQPETNHPPCRGSCESDVPHCILEIQPEQVLEAVRTLLQTGVLGDIADRHPRSGV